MIRRWAYYRFLLWLSRHPPKIVMDALAKEGSGATAEQRIRIESLRQRLKV
jgi:hypothetical protein